MVLELTLLPDELSICRLRADAEVPSWAVGGFWSLTRTTDELSVVCESERVPADVRRQEGCRALKVAGPIDFGVTGVLASLSVPLAEANVPIFAISTFDTDYLLVRGVDVERAASALRARGHRIGL